MLTKLDIGSMIFLIIIAAIAILLIIYTVSSLTFKNNDKNT
jgi:hypothetical protein